MKLSLRPRSSFLLSLIAAQGIVSCGSSSGGETLPVPSDPVVLYVTDSTTLGQREIWKKEGQDLTLLSAPLPAGISVSRVHQSADQSTLLIPYRRAGNNWASFVDLQGNLVQEIDLGTQILPGGEEVFFSRIKIHPTGSSALVELESPGWSAPKLQLVSALGTQSTLSDTRQIREFSWAPDGAAFLFHFGFSASNEFLNVYDPNGNLLAAIQSGGALDKAFREVGWSPGGNQLAYRADYEPFMGSQRREAYIYDLGLGISMELGNNLAVQRSLGFSRDGGWYSYVADPTNPGLSEPFAAGTLNPGSPIPLAPTPAASSGEVTQVRWSPATDQVAFVASHRRSDTLELFLADPLGEFRPLHDLFDGTQVTALEWSPDGQRIAYLADHTTPGVQDLYMGDPASNAAPVRLGQVLAGEHIEALHWSPDSRWLVAEYENNAADRHRLVGFERDPLLPQVDLGQTDASPGRFFTWGIAPDSRGVVWTREDSGSGVQEVVLTNFADPAGPVVLSGPYAPGVEGAVTWLSVQ